MKKPIKPTDQAFPVPPTTKPNGERQQGVSGMDLRTYTAIQLMPSADQIPNGDEHKYARVAVKQADALIDELNKASK